MPPLSGLVFRARRYFFDSVCGCGGAGVCVWPFGRMVAEKGFEPCIRFDVCDRCSSLDFVVGHCCWLLSLCWSGQFSNLASRLPQLIGFIAEHGAAVVARCTYGRYVEADQASIIAWLWAHGQSVAAARRGFPVFDETRRQYCRQCQQPAVTSCCYYFLLDWQRWSCRHCQAGSESVS